MEITGTVTKVDSLHFELADDANTPHLFAIAMDASLEAGELPALQRDGTRVVVDYDDDTPDIHVAHRVFRAPPTSAPHPPAGSLPRSAPRDR